MARKPSSEISVPAHLAKVKHAEDSINDVFNDTGVCLEQTLRSLEKLQEQLDICVTAIKNDLNEKENDHETN